ncbi:guanine nucleotide binding protein, alpha subunit [Whalleya microplaca]|nr:guanine nucleotide binding protein, alpha subunit [Whalleya microplaca]
MEEMEHPAHTIFMQKSSSYRNTPPHSDVARAIISLWCDPKFQSAYRRRHEYQLLDSTSYYATNIERLIPLGSNMIGPSEYVPTNEDILRTCVKTCGISVSTLPFLGNKYRFLDLRGTRLERKKWIHAWDAVSIVIFTIDTAAYSTSLWEDEMVNRMQEQFALFKSMINSPRFVKTNFIVAFTKIDLLDERLQLIPVGRYLLDYVHDDAKCTSPVECYMQYLEGLFRDQSCGRRW